ncbi:SAM-dependent chlorinase/fluorinase [Lacinutrix neustonica]|uniref:SAM-dependent chlorinase/fluorinase n=1 Tax=Lacinutrix neustonica TaxID=2980107 RepID=A0A9E8SEE3_9FLAO|nr:SAM-dependent chlorinase/fluorinase [Lacinutrix neustonica]WAC02239.1 SAM-dependent chlorinase/fluorinase [Lacinutrix neustonica]
MAIITLTTDFGEKDHFAGAIKGAIYSELADVRIVDISHSVSPFNIPRGGLHYSKRLQQLSGRDHTYYWY